MTPRCRQRPPDGRSSGRFSISEGPAVRDGRAFALPGSLVVQFNRPLAQRYADVTFLIDGYNLMHAVGLIGPGTGTLERARDRFLDWLADKAKDRPDTVRVVFDAEKGRGRSPETTLRGVRVRFSFRRTADDDIEELLAAERHPERVTVVSNDTRLQAAGRRRGSAVHTCEQFVDWLLRPSDSPSRPGSPPPVEKPDQATPDEMAAWLVAFDTPPKRPPMS